MAIWARSCRLFLLLSLLPLLGYKVGSVVLREHHNRSPPPPAFSPEEPAAEHEGSEDISLRYTGWAAAAWQFVQALDCAEVFFTTERECRQLLARPRDRVAVYLAEPGPDRLVAVLPDGGLSRAGAHDAVLVLDPYPTANFGHLVLVFFVDLHTSRLWCQRQGGTHLDDGSCLLLALKKRCKNALERRMRRRNFARRCEVDFLPLVHVEERVGRPRQLLSCRPGLPGFAPCPVLRPTNDTDHLICNPLRDNTKRCETSHETIHTSCRDFEICDQAVLVSGGWDRFSSLPYHKENIVNMYRMLRSYGFKRQNIKIFFANGADGIEVEGEPIHRVYPAALKLAMRYHVQKMCSSPHCVDSLLLYLNGPARSDGTTLLWDIDGDGQSSEKEHYTLEELMSDLENCEAGQVQVVADQSFSGEIARAVKRSAHHRNVAVFASSRDHEYSYGAHFTDHWVRANHTHTCAQDVHRGIRKKALRSSPELSQGADVQERTIFGAPCDVIPPFSRHELQRDYFGCQNVPTALWVIKFRSFNAEEETSPDSESSNSEPRPLARRRGT